MNRIELSDEEWVGASISKVKEVACDSYRNARYLQAIYWRILMDITFGGAVASAAANVW